MTGRTRDPLDGALGAFIRSLQRNVGALEPQAKRVGTFDLLKEAQDAYQEALRRENPDLHSAPARVERPAETAAVQRGDPDAA